MYASRLRRVRRYQADAFETNLLALSTVQQRTLKIPVVVWEGYLFSRLPLQCGGQAAALQEK